MKKAFYFMLLLSINSQAQFRLVQDIYTGSGDSNPINFHVYNGKLFFGAVNPLTNLQTIYISDGTTQGTYPLELSFTSGSFATATNYEPEFFNFNSELYFSARTAVPLNSSDSYVVKVSGNGNVINLVYQLSANTGEINSSFSNAVFLNNKIIFNPLSAESFLGGVEPYVIDLNNSSNSGVLKDIHISDDSNPSEFTFFDNKIYFSATNNLTSRDVYRSNGLTSGTTVFLGATDGFPDTNANNFNVLGNDLVFAAFTVQYGNGIYKTNGSNGNWTFLANGAYAENFKLIDNILYFSASDGANGHELWRSDGTSAGTYMLKNINVSGDSLPKDFIKIGDDIFFVAIGDFNNGGTEIWKTDGTSNGTSLVKEINPNGSSDPTFLTEYNGKLYFVADDGVHGRELWTSNGTNSGTYILELNIGGTGSNNSHLKTLGDELFFNANSGNGLGLELYAYKDPLLSINDFNSTQLSVLLFPNPSNKYFKIESEEALECIEIYTIHGQFMKTYMPQNQYDISDLSNGMYFVSINVNNKRVLKRITKR